MPQDQDIPDAFSFLSSVLTPGSSLHPTFLIIVDCTFSFLLLIFITLAIITGGNIHALIMMAIELCLWASVKWFVAELQVQGVPAQGAMALPEKKIQ